MENLTGQTIKGYELQERIGAGGFGAVYRARQTTVGREVAVKIILPDFANKPDFIRRFESEAQIVARLEHMHIIPLYDYWRDPTGAYIVMRLFRGGSLRNALEEGPFDLEPAARLLDQITSALALAHRNEIIHRDLKPGNVLLDEDGNAYLADFGIAKVLGDLTSDLTQGGIIGSLDYISPEQARSDPVTSRTDIYSLGVVLYETLVGEHPFPKSNSVERLYKHVNDPLPKITNLNGIGEAVNEVIQKATAKNPAKRYADVLELAAAFREAANLSQPGLGVNIVEQLTFREQEVLGLIVEGKSNREIAQLLVITHGTVKWYVNQIYQKLGVRNRVQAIVRARELNLIFSGTTSDAPPLPATEAISVSLLQPVNPYKGLRAFQSADHRHFFGRDGLVEKLIGHLSHHKEGNKRFLAVVGPSGSGKSSVVKAGLIPALWRGNLPGSERWFVVEMLPGAHPLDELEVALIKVAANQSGSLHEQLVRDPRGLLRVAQIILPEDDSELVIVIDQFEEVFTFAENEKACVQFLDLLTAAVTDPRSRVRVVITLRADFYDRPLHYPDFGELVRENMETILPLSAEGLTQAIRKPAELVGVTFEDGLVPTIVEEIHYQAGALPLLQYALTELFDQREGRLLTRKAYNEMGGTTGALAKRADEIYESLTPEGQEAARQMFLRLVTLGEGVEDTRRRVPRSELMALATNTSERNSNLQLSTIEDLMDELLDTFTAYRLLSLDNDPGTRTPTVEVAHEAILREWERLRAWLDESRADVRMQRVLGHVAGEWQSGGRDASFLLLGSRLTQFESWAQTTDLALTTSERAFLDASLKARQAREAAEAERQAREQALEQRSQNFLRALVGVFAIATIIAVFLSVFAFNQQRIAQSESQSRATQQAIAEAQADIAATNAANASKQQGIAEAEADARATQQAIAEDEADARTTQQALAEEQKEIAEQQAALAQARELALVANLNLALDPHLSLLLSFQSLQLSRLFEGEDALRKALHESRVTMMLGVEEEQGCLAYSPDGALLAASEGGGVIRVYDTVTGELRITLEGHDDVVTHLVFSPDGSMLVSGSFDATVRLWDMETGQEIIVFDGHHTVISSVAFSPDGSRVVSGADKDKVIIWDARTGEPLLTMEYLLYGDVLFSPDGQRIITDDETAEGALTRVRDAETGALLSTLPGQNFMGFLAISPDGRFLATGDESGYDVLIWDLEEVLERTTPQPLYRISTGHTGFVVDVAFSQTAEGMRLATGSIDTKAMIWSISHEGGEALMTLAGHANWIYNVEFDAEGKHLATGSTGEPIRIWDVTPESSREWLTFTGHEVRVNAVAYSPDGARIASGDQDGTVQIWDAETGQVQLVFTEHKGAVYAVTFNEDGTHLATAGADNTAIIWDAETGDELMTLAGHLDAPPSGGVYSGIVRIAYHPTEPDILATAAADGTVRFWDTMTGENVAIYQAHPKGNGVVGLAFSPDGAYLAVGTDDGINTLAPPLIQVLDLSAGRELYTLDNISSRGWGLAFSPDGESLITGSGDFFDIFDAKTGDKKLSIPNTAAYTIKAWPGQDIIFATGFRDVIAWDFNTGQKLFSLPGHAGFVNFFDISPDGTRLATASRDGTVKIYLLDVDELMSLAETRLARWFTPAECLQYLHIETCPPPPWGE